MAPFPPPFDALYVISDLHLGGAGDFQIFNRGARLAAFIRHVAAERTGQDVAVVLNGDVFDSLAEDGVAGYVALDADTAERMMQRLYTDASFAPVWDALGDFVRTPQRHLVFVAGNHDIELSLPVVEHSIRERLAPGEAAAQARLHFATHGAGFACRVGDARVFCTHGNEVDPWNRVDHDALAQLANAMNAGRGVPPARWTPNAGTRLVVDVMNPLKRRFPFIDLLKPEHAALVGVLLALRQDVFTDVDLRPFLAIGRERAQSQDLVARTLAPSAATAEEALQPLLGPNLRAATRPTRSEDELLRAALVAAARERTPPPNLPPVDVPEAEHLGHVARAGAVLAGIFGILSQQEALRLALQDWLRDDATYAVDTADEWDDALGRRAGAAVDYLVAGHTHLARARRRENGFYFNSGTWIRLLRLTPQVLADRQAFARLWSVLECGRMSALDEALIPGAHGAVPLVFDRTTAVRVARDADGVGGELLRVEGGASATQPITLMREDGTAPFRRP